MKAAIFDMDGTLINSMYYWRIVAAEVLRELGIEPPDELKREMYLMSVRKTPPLMRAHYTIQLTDAELNMAFDRIMAHHYANDVAMKPDADKYLASLRARGIPCVLATATGRAQTTKLLDKFDLRKYFLCDGRELIVCGAEMGMTKASDEYYPKLMELIDQRPEDCVLFEDALYSMLTAKRAGLKVWAIEDDTALRNREKIIELADRYFYCWKELIE